MPARVSLGQKHRGHTACAGVPTAAGTAGPSEGAGASQKSASPRDAQGFLGWLHVGANPSPPGNGEQQMHPLRVQPSPAQPPSHGSRRKASSPYPSTGIPAPAPYNTHFQDRGRKHWFSTGTLEEQLGMDGRKLGRVFRASLWSRNPRAPLPGVVWAVWEGAVCSSSLQPCQ